ncbi:hypothetical protein PROFUN_03199 [Planoprotostelium fungivorum]|uniref:Uncharacterized protein n=1 Tax=Planoprotostelium fungivorum TaxID=1890364 RepID=A0A2P6NWZ5_9EUKA|nr:hypothetical protein PROFUN_03199 [Planoprotostelium fungivorum]
MPQRLPSAHGNSNFHKEDKHTPHLLSLTTHPTSTLTNDTCVRSLQDKSQCLCSMLHCEDSFWLFTASGRME